MELLIVLGIVGPFQVLLIAGAYLALLIAALILVFKNEKGWLALIWAAIVLLMPFLGSLVYLLKHFVNANSRNMRHAD